MQYAIIIFKQEPPMNPGNSCHMDVAWRKYLGDKGVIGIEYIRAYEGGEEIINKIKDI